MITSHRRQNTLRRKLTIMVAPLRLDGLELNKQGLGHVPPVLGFTVEPWHAHPDVSGRYEQTAFLTSGKYGGITYETC